MKFDKIKIQKSLGSYLMIIDMQYTHRELKKKTLWNKEPNMSYK